MRLDFSWSFRYSATIFAGVLAVTMGCSPSPDKNSSPDKKAGASSASLIATPAATTGKSADSAKSSETPPAASPDSSDMLIPTPPVAQRVPLTLDAVEPDAPAIDPVKTDPPKERPAKD